MMDWFYITEIFLFVVAYVCFVVGVIYYLHQIYDHLKKHLTKKRFIALKEYLECVRYCVKKNPN